MALMQIKFCSITVKCGSTSYLMMRPILVCIFSMPRLEMMAQP